MRQPTHLGHGVPETDTSLGPAFVAAAVVLAALLAFTFPLAAAVLGGALAVTAVRSLRRAVESRASRRRLPTAPTPTATP